MLDTDDQKSSKRWIKWIVIGGIAAAVLFFAGIFVYANFINDAPDELDQADLSNALVATTDVASLPETTIDTVADASTPASFLGAVERAVHAWRDPDIWRSLQRNAMAKNFGWKTSAGRYLELYRAMLDVQSA